MGDSSISNRDFVAGSEPGGIATGSARNESGRFSTNDANFSPSDFRNAMISALVDQEIKRIVSANYERAHRILVEYKAVLVNIADELLTREVLDGEQVRRMVRGLSLDEPRHNTG